jgi:short chain dehydrogenase
MIGENRMTRRGWAIVTGASGGMGAAFTKALAKRGYSVLAVARGLEPLARMVEELKKDGAFVETLAVDLASAEGLKTLSRRSMRPFMSWPPARNCVMGTSTTSIVYASCRRSALHSVPGSMSSHREERR